MNILVTGGLGLIGHNIVRILEAEHNISITDTKTNYGFIPQAEIDYLMVCRQQRIQTASHGIDIRNHEHLDFLFNKTKPELVIHTASYPRQKAVEADPALASEVMNTGLTNLLELCKKHHVRRFVYISSSMVYGDFENDVTEKSVCSPIGQYGIFKLMGEHLVKDYARRTGLEYQIIRPSAVYGEYDVEDRVVSKFLLTAIRNQTLKVKGAGEVLDFTYVEDAARGIVQAALTDKYFNETFNITRSDTTTTTLADAAELAVKLAGQGTIEYAERDLSFPKRGRLDITKAQQLLGYQPQVNVEAGFKRYYEWLIKSSYYTQHDKLLRAA